MPEQFLEEGQGFAGRLGPGAGAVVLGGRQKARSGRVEFLADLGQNADEEFVHVVVESCRRLRVAAVVFGGQLGGVCQHRIIMMLLKPCLAHVQLLSCTRRCTEIHSDSNKKQQ